jgi:hypothetical protein
MAARQRHSWWGLAVVVAFAAACSNSTGPQAHLASPQQLSSNLQAVSGVFQSTAFQGFGAIGTAPGSPATVTTPVGALLQAAPITAPRTSSQPYADAPRRLQALRLAASTLHSGISASVVPPSLLGTTWVWNTTAHTYEQDGTFTPAAPTDRVRIILYALDPLTGGPAENPLTPVGFADLVDESTTTPAVDKLHVIVKDGTPASPGPVTYADYTVSGSVTGNPATAFTATAVGFVSDGTHTLNFSASFSGTNLTTDNPDAEFDARWDLDNPVVHVELHETLATSDASHVKLTIDLSVTSGAETLAVTGSLTVVALSPTAFSVTANLTITVNGVPYAHVTGTDSGIQLTHADGSSLSAQEFQAVSDLFDLPDQMEVGIDNLFGPCEHLMGA